MASLHDIAPAQHRVQIPSGATEVPVDVRGLTLQDVSDLMARFPDIAGAFSGGVEQDKIVPLILRMGPEVIAAAIAYACGAANDPASEKIVAAWPIGTQAEILAIVVRLTAPKGAGPFVELMRAAGLSPSMAASAAKQAAQSPKPSRTSAATGTDSPTS